MSAILAVITPSAGIDVLADRVLATRMLARMTTRGGLRSGVWSAPGVLLAASRQEWELGADFSGPALVLVDRDVAVVADASLYYRGDLRRTLARTELRPTGDTPSHLILAAYRAFGERCAEVLEGDFAFVVWDRAEGRVVAARDFGGKRPLHYALIDGGKTLVLASTVGGVLAHPHCPDDLNAVAVAEVAANRWPMHTETCYRSISSLRAAHTLVAGTRPRVRVEVRRYWTPPAFDVERSPVSFDDAADELRTLLCHATAERLGRTGTTSVWMSGGADSPAVFACGKHVIEQSGDGRQLLPVSLSFPVGDPGREDELITAIASRWNTPVRWIDTTSVRMIDRPMERAIRRDEPFAHAYETSTRALAEASRSLGARVAFDGNGGDQLFYVSDVYLADLLRAGAVRKVYGQRRVKGLRGVHSFWATAVQPQLPRSVRAACRAVGLPGLVSDALNRRLPTWIDRRFAARTGLVDRGCRELQRSRGEGCAAFENRWLLTQEYFARTFSVVAQLALETGVENRSPLFDTRIVRFAATRPQYERSSGGRTKQLLSRSMHGLLPQELLAPRPIKTGLAVGFFTRGMTEGLGPLMLQALDGSCELADLGVIDVARFRAATAEYERTRDDNLGLALFLTLQTELWLRAHARGGAVSIPPHARPTADDVQRAIVA